MIAGVVRRVLLGEIAVDRERLNLTLDAPKVIGTIVTLQRRIVERFPGAGLGAVCGDLLTVAQASSARAEQIARRHMLLRLGLLALSVGGVALLAWVLSQVDYSRTGGDSVFTVFQGIEAVANLVVLTGGTLLFMITIEQRLKRRRALAALHELRAIMHVIDMHQLTKDPTAAVIVGGKTASSPARTLTPYELSRYLDYCSEMMSLTSKVAVLFAQSLPDPVVTEAVSDIERIASGMSQKIWQKIMMLDTAIRQSPASAHRPPAVADGMPPQVAEST
jgi:hypothetical protein